MKCRKTKQPVNKSKRKEQVRHMKRRGLFGRRLLLGALTMLMVVGGLLSDSGIRVSAATAVSKVPITAYLKGYSTVRTYDRVNGKVTGSIFSSDKCSILNVYSSGWCRVRYPVSKGTRTAYTYSSYFFTNTTFSTSVTKPGKNRTVYGKPNLSYQLGTTFASDSILIIGSSNGNQQILYPVSGGYKMGFISGSISTGTANTSGYRPVVYNASQSEIESLCFDAKYYADTYPDLKAAYGYDSAKLLYHWKKYGIREGRGASPILDLTYYMANNADLRKAFGSGNYAGAYQHFLQFGYAEYRASSKYYNGDYYRRNNADLKPYDGKFLLSHYLKHGIQEKRYANTVRYTPSGAAAASAASSNRGTVQNNIYHAAMGSVGTTASTYQSWAGLSKGTAWCVAYATWVANQGMVRSGYSSTAALNIVPKKASTAYLADWYKARGRYYSLASWNNKSRGVSVTKNATTASYIPKVGDLVAIDNNGVISSGPEHTAIVIAVNGNSLTTAEGNTNDKYSTDNRPVKTYTYTKGASYWVRSDYSKAKIVGFCNPAY